MDRLGRFAATVSGRVAATAVVAVLSGCTMCPDPYDYSGPVPNGSSPQNDFRARSKGILPLSAAPCPWPPLVEHAAGHGVSRLAATGASRRTGEPTLADPPSDAGPVEQAMGTGETASILVVVGEEASDDEVVAAPTVADAPPVVLAEIDESSTSAEEELTATIPPAEPALAETPGWRTRQRR
ncbi:MAG: hypothetical protein K8S94_08880 [Planctomycetia bacterium]|nr:hypothetical protein [Planctomycetia bacterium]